MTLLLHGVVRQDHPFVASGVPDELDVELVEQDGLAVIVRDLPDDTQLTEDDGVSFLDVLVGAVQGGPVLPLRFGTVAPDADSVRSEVLGPPAGDDLSARMDAIAELVELRITFTLNEDTLQTLFDEDPQLRAAASRGGPSADMSERVELGRLVAERLAARRSHLVAEWVATFDDLVEEANTLSSSDEGWEQVAFLVRRERLGQMDATVATLAERIGEEALIDYVGPLPIYSFDPASSATPAQAASQGSRWGF
ncbi:GvpL/GvpF family gas vesicle protein [Actinopolymorpha pittospori]